MQIEVLPIRSGSHEVRVFPEGSDLVDGYTLSMNLQPIDDDNVELTMMSGDMTAAINVALGFECLKLGYKYIHFKARKDARVTRWAERTGGDATHDFWMIDLEASKKILMEGDDA